MTDPRTPASKEKEAQLPDDLDQNPGIGQAAQRAASHGSQDAQLIAGESATEGDAGNDLLPTND
jgi:hypothetical protein